MPAPLTSVARRKARSSHEMRPRMKTCTLPAPMNASKPRQSRAAPTNSRGSSPAVHEPESEPDRSQDLDPGHLLVGHGFGLNSGPTRRKNRAPRCFRSAGGWSRARFRLEEWFRAARADYRTGPRTGARCVVGGSGEEAGEARRLAESRSARVRPLGRVSGERGVPDAGGAERSCYEVQLPEP